MRATLPLPATRGEGRGEGPASATEAPLPAPALSAEESDRRNRATLPVPAPTSAARPRATPAPFPASTDGANQVVRAEPAALWRRVCAWVIDFTFITTLAVGFLLVASNVIAPPHLSLTQQFALMAVPGVALGALLAFVYTTLFAFLWYGRTPGRLALNIHLVDDSGRAPRALRSLTRAGLSLVSFALFLSGFWLALFDRHGQTLHDKLTRTFVVRFT